MELRGALLGGGMSLHAIQSSAKCWAVDSGSRCS